MFALQGSRDGKMSRRRRRRGGLDLLTALTVLVALDGGDVAVDGFSK